MDVNIFLSTRKRTDRPVDWFQTEMHWFLHLSEESGAEGFSIKEVHVSVSCEFIFKKFHQFQLSSLSMHSSYLLYSINFCCWLAGKVRDTILSMTEAKITNK